MQLFTVKELSSADFTFNDLYYRVQGRSNFKNKNFRTPKSVVLINTGSLDACHSGAAINELNIKDIAGVRDGEDAEKQSQRLKELENLT